MGLIQKLREAWLWFQFRRTTRNAKDETWDNVQRCKALGPEEGMRELKRLQALRFIRMTLQKDLFYTKPEYLKTIVVRDFDAMAPEAEYLPTDVSDRKLRKMIAEKAERYYAEKSDLLELLAESFVAEMRRELGKTKS